MLRARGWLSRTPASFREAVLSQCQLRSFAAGETIYAQGDTSTGLWGLAKGSVGIELSGLNQDPSFAYFSGNGFWIGAHTLVVGPGRQVGLVALRPSKMLHLPGATFHTIAQQQDLEAWRWLAVLPLIQVAVAMGTLTDLLIRDPKRRCAAILLRLAGCRGPVTLDEPEEIHVTQEQLSEMMNLSRTALGGILRSFEAERLISRQYGRISINRLMLEGVITNAQS